ncbi:MAG TPA: sn-glycerol-3-phosphate ABC transporter ATP-binding protein UgpC, partial [Beutenbergiaceae bacterium]|nr:sn-glycerol-3-phosphate ABC transporter ATP-binding protein UgpC [Beutenbergiaceae bacterium]
MASVTYETASRIYPGTERPAVDSLDLEIEDGEFLVLVGPSGCGKSTSLRMLAGLEDVNTGRILIGDRDVTDVQPKDRDIAMVFQNYALYPHMSVADNMGFALKIAGKPKAEIRERVEEAAKILDLTEYLDRKPKALSGGQRQRVAMGRAIVRNPQVFLMDEPLSNLDAKLRVATRAQIATLQRDLRTTMIYVTHDQVEAMTMGDRVAVLRDGVLQQVAAPRDLYNDPVNAFVAGFIGSPAMNLFDVPVSDGRVDREGFGESVPAGAGRLVTVGVRPEHLRLVGPGEGMPVTVNLVEELGADSFLHCSTADGHPVVYRAESSDHPTKGDTAHLAALDSEVRFFDP